MATGGGAMTSSWLVVKLKPVTFVALLSARSVTKPASMATVKEVPAGRSLSGLMIRFLPST